MITPKTFIIPITTVKPIYCKFISGNKFVAYTYVCPNCKSYVKENQKYCHECGMKLEWNKNGM